MRRALSLVACVLLDAVLVEVSAPAVVDDDGREALDLEAADRFRAEVLVRHPLERLHEARERTAAPPPMAPKYTALCRARASFTGCERAPLPMVPLRPRARRPGVNVSMRPPVVGPTEPTTSPGRAGDGPV